MENFVKDAIGETRTSLGERCRLLSLTRSRWPLAAADTHSL